MVRASWLLLVLLGTCPLSTAGAQPPAPSQPPAAPAPAPRPPEEADEGDIPEVEETVVVSATRSERRLQDEPLRVEVIDQDEIEEKALMTPGSVAMLLGETTGLRVQATAPSLGAANVRIQGLRGRYAQLLADGLPLYGSGGDSLGLLQVPPLDLGRVEVIKGAASALYGPAALGGVINLVSRQAASASTEALLNVTTLGGADATMWLARTSSTGWAWTLLGGAHGQSRRDRDDDGWTDVAGYARGVVRPRVTWDSGAGTSLFLTGGLIAEDRQAGTIGSAVAPDGSPFAERLDSRRADVGGAWRRVLGARVLSLRGSWARNGQDRRFGEVRERGTRETAFGEVALTGIRGRQSWVVGGALQQDRYAPRDVRRAAYRFTVPAVFVQDQVDMGPRASLSASARLDAHSEYGALFSPRVSLLLRPSPAWTTRVSAGGGAFAPTPFTEETDETGLSRLAPLAGLRAERAASFNADLTWTHGPFEVTATGFASRVSHAVQLATLPQLAAPSSTGITVALVNAASPTRTWGTELLARYRRGALVLMATHAWTSSTELDVDEGTRRDVPLTPRHALSFNAMLEGAHWGRAGLEAYYVGQQPLEDDPYRTVSRRYLLLGALFERRFGAVRLFVNAENLFDVRQTTYAPLIRPTRLPDGRWTVGAWAPLDGRVVNGGLRVGF
ncbi:ligand-gated channel protein [Luteitalea sp. TBR-22]|uniref:TonB-dependent receptor plug domain-containing protein n=1 Tax=Luteitalea sp. TBR-22 TaxID=2802971 RepID=UPI001EF608DE|nr:TonB-dependent receptor [Luteitalea sp. TBR-22]BCS34805.2 ligand-gated channel protein [Luteitalea sp. TBR-22]